MPRRTYNSGKRFRSSMSDGWSCRALLGLVLMSLPMWAQDVTGTVQGAVTDSAGGTVTGAKVELINEGTGVTTVRTTNADGDYHFNFVPPGRYTVTASLTGFKMVNTSGVDVAVNKTTRVNLTLEVGALTESVQVTADAVRID